MFRDKEIFVTDHAIKRFVERTGVSSNTPRIGAEKRIIKSVKRAEHIEPKRIVGLKTEKGTTYAFDPFRQLLYPLESIDKGRRFRVVTCLTKEEFGILGA